MNIKQLELEIHETYNKDGKITANIEPFDNEDVINKTYLDEKLPKTQGQISCFEKSYNEFKLQNNKQFVEEILIQTAVKTTIQILYDKGLFDTFPNADSVVQELLFVIRRRGVLEESK